MKKKVAAIFFLIEFFSLIFILSELHSKMAMTLISLWDKYRSSRYYWTGVVMFIYP